MILPNTGNDFAAGELRAALLQVIDHPDHADGAGTPSTEPEATYRRAVADLLTLLGLLRQTDLGLVVTNDTAAWLIKSFAAHLSDSLVLDDDSQAAWLTTIEAARYRAGEQRHTRVTPIREIDAANALIKRTVAGRVYLLMQYDQEAAQFQLIGGKREATDPDLAYTVLREIREELNCPQITVPIDLQLIACPERFDNVKLSPTFGVISQYHIAFFHVQGMRFQPVIDQMTRWISVDEMKAGQLLDGRRVSQLAVEVFADQLKGLSDSLSGELNTSESYPVA